MPQLKVQNQYRWLITSAIAASGDVSFTVSVSPTYTNGFIVVSPDLSTKREVMYFDNVIGNTIYVKWVNRTSPKSHSSTEVIQMNDVAEIFNTYSDMLSQAFYVEKTWSLNVKVWGWYVLYNGNQVTVADTNLTLADNTTNYIKYTFNTNTVSVDTSNTGNIKAVVTTVSGGITSIVYRFSKESLIDFTVALTGALPSQAGNAGKALVTDGTNASWQSPLPSQTGNAGKNLQTDGINASWQSPTVASTTVAGQVEISTQAEFTASTDTWGTGAQLVVTPSQIQAWIRWSQSNIAWENITMLDVVRMEEMFTWQIITTVPWRSIAQLIWNVAWNTKTSIRIIWNWVSSSSVILSLAKVWAPADNVIVRIETDLSWVPSGTLANANATSTVVGTWLTTSQVATTCTFAWSFSLSNWIPYHIVVSRSTANDGVNHFSIWWISKTSRSFVTNLFNTSWWTAITTNMYYISYSSMHSSVIVKWSALVSNTAYYQWIALNTVSIWWDVWVQVEWLCTLFSWLTNKWIYYMSDTVWVISTTPWTIKRIVWYAVWTTSLYIINAMYNNTLLDQSVISYQSYYTLATANQWVTSYYYKANTIINVQITFTTSWSSELFWVYVNNTTTRAYNTASNGTIITVTLIPNDELYVVWWVATSAYWYVINIQQIIQPIWRFK